MPDIYEKQHHEMHNYDDFFKNKNIRRPLLIIFQQLGKTSLIGLNIVLKR